MQNLQVLLDSFPDYAFVLDREGHILHSNEKAKISLGRDKSSIYEILPAKVRTLEARINETIEGKGPFNLSPDGIDGTLALLTLEKKDAVVIYLKEFKVSEKSNDTEGAVFRLLSEIANDSNLSFDEKIQRAISCALDMFQLDIGIISRIKGNHYTVLASVSRLSEIDIPSGSEFELDQTYCEVTWKRREVVAVPHARVDDIYSQHPSYKNMQLESYIGLPLYVKGRPFGTFNLSSPRESQNGIDQGCLQYFRLLGMWIEKLIESNETSQRNRELNTLFKGIFYESPEAMIFIGADRTIQKVNNSFKKLFGLDENDVIGANTRILYSKEEDYASLFDKKQIDKATGTFSYEMIYKKKNGSAFVAETIGYPVRDDQGEVSGYIGIMRDRTLEIQREKELKEQKALAEHHSRFAAIGEISAGVSHEVNNPLAVAKGYAAIIGQKTEKGDSNIYKDLEKIDQSIDRVSSIVRSLGVLARQENDYGEHGALELIDETVNLVREFYRRQGIKIQIEKGLEGGLDRVRCHKGKTHQAFYYLLEWARSMVLASGSDLIEIKISQEEGWAQALICSNTKLINWEKALMDNSSSNKFISLKVAKSILFEENCKLECRSNEEEGNRVAVLLPLADTALKKSLA